MDYSVCGVVYMTKLMILDKNMSFIFEKPNIMCIMSKEASRKMSVIMKPTT